MTPTVHIIGTLDTKGAEIAYLRDRLRALGVATTVVDSGILGNPVGIALEEGVDISRSETAAYAGQGLEALRAAGTRGRAVSGMRDSLKQLILDRFREGKVAGVVALGGAEGAVMGAATMMQLPIGVPKVLVSPIASGKHFFAPLVGTSDIFVVHSIVDILGLNPIATTIYDNVAAALAGMVAHGHLLPPPTPDSKYVAVTMLGNTTRAVMALRDRLAEAGYEAVIFHSNGVGGTAMEELAEAGYFVGVIDYTTNEIYDPMTGGIHDAGPDRLRRVGRAGVPQVAVPGCVDFSVFHAGHIPDHLRDRPVYDHNPEYTLVRATRDEAAQLGALFAQRLNEATAPVHIVVPTQGLSIPNVPGGVFWDPEADGAFLDALRANIRSDIPITTIDRHINDAALGVQVADHFIEMMDRIAGRTESHS